MIAIASSSLQEALGMAAHALKVGDQVTFNGKAMTVVVVSRGRLVTCEWLGPRGATYRRTYHPDSLKRQ